MHKRIQAQYVTVPEAILLGYCCVRGGMVTLIGLIIF